MPTSRVLVAAPAAARRRDPHVTRRARVSQHARPSSWMRTLALLTSRCTTLFAGACTPRARPARRRRARRRRRAPTTTSTPRPRRTLGGSVVQRASRHETSPAGDPRGLTRSRGPEEGWVRDRRQRLSSFIAPWRRTRRPIVTATSSVSRATTSGTRRNCPYQ